MNEGLLIAGAVIVYLLTRTRGKGGAAREVPQEGRQDLSPGASGTDEGVDAIIDRLWSRQKTELPAYRQKYNLTRLKRVARSAAESWGVPPEWLWGMVWRESRWSPVGIYAGNPMAAKTVHGVGSTAFGMGQLLQSRFQGERAWAAVHYPGTLTWEHADLIDPKLSLYTVAASLRRALEKHGKDALTADHNQLLGQWWASPGRVTTGSTRKGLDIEKAGPNVWQDGVPSGPSPSGGSWTANEPGPTDSSDDVPPAGTSGYPGVPGGPGLPGWAMP